LGVIAVREGAYLRGTHAAVEDSVTDFRRISVRGNGEVNLETLCAVKVACYEAAIAVTAWFVECKSQDRQPHPGYRLSKGLQPRMLYRHFSVLLTKTKPGKTHQTQAKTLPSPPF